MSETLKLLKEEECIFINFKIDTNPNSINFSYYISFSTGHPHSLMVNRLTDSISFCVKRVNLIITKFTY